LRCGETLYAGTKQPGGVVGDDRFRRRRIHGSTAI